MSCSWVVEAIVARERPARRRIAVVAGAVLAAGAVAAALAIFFWVRSYAPLYSFGGSRFPTPSQGVHPMSPGGTQDA